MENNEKVCILEGITSVSALIKSIREGTARRSLFRVLIDESKKQKEFRRVSFLRAASEELGFRLEFVPPEKIASLALGHTHGGIIAEASPAEFPGIEELNPAKNGFAMLLEGAEDPFTLGHSIRVLYSSGATALILPERFPSGADTALARASAGCSELLPIFVCSPEEAARKYLKANYSIAAAEIRDAEDLDRAELTFPLLLIVGGEKRGISSSLLKLAQKNVKIPYERDFMGSLPTESAVTVFAYELMRRSRNAEK